MVEFQRESLQGVLGEIERLLVKLLADCERNAKEEAVGCAGSAGSACHSSSGEPSPLTASEPPILSTKESTGDGFHLAERLQKVPSPKSEPPPLNCSSPMAAQFKDSPCRRSMRSVNIVDDLVEIESASEESLEAFELNDCWTQIQDNTHMSRMTRRASVAMTHTQNTQTVHLVPVSQKKRCMGPFVKIWAGLFLSVILLEVVRWPLIAFEGKYALANDLSITAFQFLSIPVSATIAWCATDTWRRVLAFALLEVLLITTQCVDVLLGANSAWLRSVQLLRLLQLPRLFVMSGWSRYLHVYLVHTSREMRAVLNLFLAGLMLCLFLHLLTCLWFFVGQHGGWVQSETYDMDFTAKYMTSLEFALSRIPPSRMSENMLLKLQSERVVALLATGLTILFGSIFTSIVTNDISDVRRVRRLQREAEYQVFDFIAAFPVPWELELQLKEYLKRNRSTIQLPRKQDMASLLPEYLFNELCREAMAPIIANHSFLQSLGMRFAAFQHDLCLKGFTDWNVSNQEILFSPGPKCEHMLFVAYGTVGYMCKAGAADFQDLYFRCSRLSLGTYT
ncbi:unnamed protein product [Symbiodinium necroappetens]|uniref:Uncharacterized protein n=1 Tax=Symbiodinium necroappetens TaxID=1628268 RepID=A0A812M2N0_9DINO|nr:unnamed protein product [Symbiodinium necroappetens]